MPHAVAGTTCPACEHLLKASGNGDYACVGCGEVFDILEMYLP